MNHMRDVRKTFGILLVFCLLFTLPGAALAQTAEKPAETAQTGGWPAELIGSWIGLHENLWTQYTFYQNGKYDLTVFEDPSLDRSGTRETLGKDNSVAVDGDLMKLTALGIMSTFRRIPESSAYVRLKTKDAAVDPSVTPRLVGTWGGRIKDTYIEWTFGADGSFSQVTPAEASVLEGHYIAGGLELAIKMGGKFIHCAYVIRLRQGTVTVDLPDEGKVTLNKKAGQLKLMLQVADYGVLWPHDAQTPKGPLVGRYLGNQTEVGIPVSFGYSSAVGIGENAFAGNKSMESITMPILIGKIGSEAFEGCESLKDVLFIGRETILLDPELEGVRFTAAEYFAYELSGMPSKKGSCALKTIGEGAFRGCTSLQSLNLAGSAAPATHTQLWQGIWIGRSDVRGINLPDGLETIGAYAFEGCESITSVSIPDSVTEIGMNAFKGCGRVTLIVAEGSYAYSYAKGNGIPFIRSGE